MGLNMTTGKVTYLNLKSGKFAKKNANGDIELYDQVEGVIKSADFKDDEYNGTKFKKLVLKIVDGDETFILSIRQDSGYFRGLTNSIANADISKAVKLVASSKEVNGKPQTTIFVSQSGQALKWKWTKENPGNLPALESVKLKGKTVYDNSAQQAFYEQFWNGVFNTAVGTTSDDLPF